PGAPIVPVPMPVPVTRGDHDLGGETATKPRARPDPDAPPAQDEPTGATTRPKGVVGGAQAPARGGPEKPQATEPGGRPPTCRRGFVERPRRGLGCQRVTGMGMGMGTFLPTCARARARALRVSAPRTS